MSTSTPATEQTPEHVLVTGASSGIGLAAVRLLLQAPAGSADVSKLAGSAIVHAVARRASQCQALIQLQAEYGRRLQLHDTDLTDDDALRTLGDRAGHGCSQLRLVFNAAGILHSDQLQPEKSITQIRRRQLAQVFDLNAYAPILLAQSLLPLLRGRHQCCFASLSARVGSIGDNRLGGWYAYRASKAAQNQLLRTFAVELKRLNRNACALLLHPGTVDTPLSAPFQSNVPDDKLFSTERAARQLLQLAAAAGPADSGRFLAWDGSEVPW